jgi:hypothetical protein
MPGCAAAFFTAFFAAGFAVFVAFFSTIKTPLKIVGLMGRRQAASSISSVVILSNLMPPTTR